MTGSVHSINISNGGVPKLPVRDATLGIHGFKGDFNRFRMESRLGDSDRAVCIFSLERIESLKAEGHPIEVGSTGENLTIRGVDWDSLEVGTRLEVGSALIELSEPCAPCGKIGSSFIERGFLRVDHETEEGWSRWLARAVEEGVVSKGDLVNIV